MLYLQSAILENNKAVPKTLKDERIMLIENEKVVSGKTQLVKKCIKNCIKLRYLTPTKYRSSPQTDVRCK